MNLNGDNFDSFAIEYDNLLKNSLGVAGGDRKIYAKYKIDYIASCIQHITTPLILDFGCGDGTSLEFLNNVNTKFTLHGIDISEGSISMAKEKDIKGCTFKSFSGNEIPYETSFFNVVFAANVMHHIPFHRHETVLREMYRVLSPGGNLFIFEHNPLNPVTRKNFKDCIFDKDATMLAPSYINEKLEKVGFEKILLTYHLFFPRIRWFAPFIRLEPYLYKVPFGGQYCTWYTKPVDSQL